MISQQPMVRMMAVEASHSNGAAQAFSTLLVIHATRKLHLGADEIGMIFMAGGIGVLLGSMLAGPHRFWTGTRHHGCRHLHPTTAHGQSALLIDVRLLLLWAWLGSLDHSFPDPALSPHSQSSIVLHDRQLPHPHLRHSATRRALLRLPGPATRRQNGPLDRNDADVGGLVMGTLFTGLAFERPYWQFTSRLSC